MKGSTYLVARKEMLTYDSGHLPPPCILLDWNSSPYTKQEHFIRQIIWAGKNERGRDREDMC